MEIEETSDRSVGISIIIQTFFQAKILKELRKFNKEDKYIS